MSKKPKLVLTEEEKEILRRIGRRAYKAMVETIGKTELAEIAQRQGQHGVEGGRPKLYDEPCQHYKGGRHRFLKSDRCRCGLRRLGKTPDRTNLH